VAALATEKRNQLEELLIWKMSDELKLSSVEEKKFSEILKSLNDEKANLNQSLQQSVDAMTKASTAKAKEAELTRYRKLTQSYAKLSEQEIDRLKPLLGVDRMVQYLSIKQDLTNKIKTLLSNENGGKAGKPLPSPKLIEEK
jgi:DNA anti-recombination protein RmuC